MGLFASAVMGISRSSQHKRRLTGGKKTIPFKKRKHALGRPMAGTRIGIKRIRTVRARGGATKYRALRLDHGNFSWGSEVCTRKTRVRCRVQCVQQRVGAYQDPGEERHRSDR